MKRILIYILLCINISNSIGQNIEFSGGVIKNNYFDLARPGENLQSKYTSGYGYSFGISIFNLKIDTNKYMLFMFKVDNYKGSFKITNSGHISTITEATVDKITLGLGIYPFHFKIRKIIRFNFGLDIR